MSDLACFRQMIGTGCGTDQRESVPQFVPLILIDRFFHSTHICAND